MDIYLLIGIIALIIAVVVVALIVYGIQRKKSKTVSFEKKDESPKELTREEKSGNYQAAGGFNFAPAKEATKEPALLPDQELASPEVKPASEVEIEVAAAETPPKVAEPVAPVEPVVPAVPVQPQQPETAESVESAEPVEDVESAEPAEAVEAAEETPKVVEPAAPAEPVAPVEPATPEPAEPVEAIEDAVPVEPTTPVEPEQTEPVEAVEVAEPAQPEIVEPVVVPEVADKPVEAVVEPTPETPVVEEVVEEAEEAAAAAQVVEEAVEAALEETPVPEEKPAPAEETAPVEDIEAASGRLGRLRGRLSRSQNVIGQGVLGILSAGDLDEDAWEEIEDTLIMADLGTAVTMKVVESLREKIAGQGVTSEAEARATLRETLIEAGRPDLDRSIKAMPYEGKPAVVLVVGVNGTGKTTTTGKLARVLVSMGHKVVLGAADTFRAAAADQLETWGKRVGASTVRGAEGADPASVAFDAVAKGIEQQADVVLIDTAGRLHTATGLMDQLGKVKRVVEKKAVVDEVLLVLDATVGQNGLTQARVFRDVVDITGVVLTKLDGTAKGGIVFKVQEELGVPVKLVGLGEGADDLAPFEIESFVDALLG
ncbi:signal recognition particle-docking protein FtsY [Corynebacterium alimapuense]|uniref:Signal recognition particle receptor FtsY n=1 Tax=Corynebacterium alimapuense TaxID=1576874 RepID=A0A3M8K9G9_9CORY|nr:signal recognition particle-docking protein FtsY [Corynebacterium alimapuense]RNE49435.1 signal recognition particle-docking protein FtsY [Corynebacterium alimapuense]